MNLARSTRRGASRADDALLRAIADGELTALGELYDRYATDVWRAVHRAMGTTADVEDVVQNVFVKLPEIAPSYDGRTNARAWLIGIGVRFALRRRRSVGRFVRMMTSFASAPPAPVAAPDPERQASAREELRTLERGLERLSPKKRAVLFLVEFDGLSTEDAARALQIPVATVRTRLHHARQELNEALRLEARRG